MEFKFLVDHAPDREQISARVSLVYPLNLPNDKDKVPEGAQDIPEDKSLENCVTHIPFFARDASAFVVEYLRVLVIEVNAFPRFNALAKGIFII